MEKERMLFYGFIQSLEKYGIECNRNKYTYTWVKFIPLTSNKLTELFQEYFKKESTETKIKVLNFWENQETYKYILDFAQIVEELNNYYTYCEQNSIIFGDLHFEISVQKLSLGYTYYCVFDYSDKALFSNLTEHLLTKSERTNIENNAFHKLETVLEMIHNLKVKIIFNYSNVEDVEQLSNLGAFTENENYFTGCKIDADTYNGFFLNCSYC